MDIYSPKKRSKIMASISGKNTKPEIIVRKYLFSKGFRYKLYDKSLPGKPDLVFPKHKTVVFVHGCFWHGHDKCKFFVIPKTRTEWWMTKIGRNKQLDKKNVKKLKILGWKVIIIFECKLKPKYVGKTLHNLESRLLQ